MTTWYKLVISSKASVFNKYNNLVLLSTYFWLNTKIPFRISCFYVSLAESKLVFTFLNVLHGSYGISIHFMTEHLQQIVKTSAVCWKLILCLFVWSEQLGLLLINYVIGKCTLWFTDLLLNLQSDNSVNSASRQQVSIANVVIDNFTG